MEAVYESVPLRVGTSTNIRVVELILPPTDDEGVDAPIICTLRTVSLTDELTCAALSYTWGDPPATKIMRLHDQDIAVQSNLWKFLHGARRRRLEGNTWIGAL
jgi:hypothetical protein